MIDGAVLYRGGVSVARALQRAKLLPFMDFVQRDIRQKV
jgi:hypothetical protein